MSDSVPGDSRRPEIPVPGRDGYVPCPSGRALYCVSHSPPVEVPARATAVLVQTGTEERKASHRTLVRLAGALAAVGVTTHRLDLPGCGESTGALEQLTWADWLADIAHAADVLLGDARADQPRYLGGLRLGATVAGACRPVTDTPRAPLRWLALAPIVRGGEYLRQLRTRRSIRSDLTAGGGEVAAATAPLVAAQAPVPAGSEEFDGFLLNAAMLQALTALELPRDLARTAGTVIQFGPSTKLTKEFQPFAALPQPAFHALAVRQEPVWERGEAVNDSRMIEAALMATGTPPPTDA